MLSAANLLALEEAGFRFIVGSKISKAPYDLMGHVERHGNAFDDGQTIEITRMMGAGRDARARRVVYQWRFARYRHDNQAINAMIDRGALAGSVPPLSLHPTAWRSDVNASRHRGPRQRCPPEPQNRAVRRRCRSARLAP
jgi:hypothetical protein